MARRHRFNAPKGQVHPKHRNEGNKSRSVTDSEEGDDGKTWQRDVHISVAIGAILLAIYVKCLHPSIPGGDSGELVVSAYELGVAHPPGYPLFTMLSKFFMTVIPVGSPAWRVNFLTAICSSAAGALLQFTVVRITGCIGSSLLALGLFSLNKLTWTWSTSAEVFGLNNFFIAAIMAVTVVFEADDERAHVERCACLAALLCSLSLCNQHTVVIYVICIALWVCLRLIKLKMLSLRLVVKLALLTLLGLTPYLYLPISSYMNTARWTWGDHRTLAGFLTHFLRQEYGTFDLGKQQTGLGFVAGSSAYWEHIHTEMCQLGPFLALIGITVAVIWCIRGEGTSVLVFSTMVVAYVVFFTWRANLDISNPLMKGVVERFWMQSDLVLAVLAGVGFHEAVRLITETFMGMQQTSMTTVFCTVGAAVVIMLQMKNYRDCDESSNFVIHDFAHTLLNSLPPDSIVLSKGDLPTNTLRYYHLCEDVRPDLQILDVEVMSYGWFLPLMRKFYPRITFPGDLWHLTNQQLTADGRRTFNFRALLDSNQPHYPIFACIGMQERDSSWQEAYMTIPYGPCSKVIPRNQPFDVVYWANRTGNYSDDWTYPFDAFKNTSWEKVANDEMWQAKIGTAFFMYQQAMQVESASSKTQLLVSAYELYFRAIKLNQIPGKMNSKEGFPSFWYKNFALTCEKLLHFEHNINKDKLCKLAIHNFKQYLYLANNDPDRPKITEAIGILQQRLSTIQQLDKVDKHLEGMAKRVDNMGLADFPSTKS